MLRRSHNAWRRSSSDSLRICTIRANPSKPGFAREAVRSDVARNEFELRRQRNVDFPTFASYSIQRAPQRLGAIGVLYLRPSANMMLRVGLEAEPGNEIKLGFNEIDMVFPVCHPLLEQSRVTSPRAALKAARSDIACGPLAQGCASAGAPYAAPPTGLPASTPSRTSSMIFRIVRVQRPHCGEQPRQP